MTTQNINICLVWLIASIKQNQIRKHLWGWRCEDQESVGDCCCMVTWGTKGKDAWPPLCGWLDHLKTEPLTLPHPLQRMEAGLGFVKKKNIYILFCGKKRSDKKDMKNESLRASTSIHLQGLFFMEKCESIIFRNLPKVENWPITPYSRNEEQHSHVFQNKTNDLKQEVAWSPVSVIL